MWAVWGVAVGLMVPGLALSATLSVGSGDGALTVTARPLGDSYAAVYDPVGNLGAADFFFESLIAIRDGDAYRSLNQFGRGPGAITPVTVSQTPTTLVTAFSIGGLGFTLTQQVSQTLDAAGAAVGAVFGQRLDITNPTGAARDLSVRRYLDPDVPYDRSFGDRAGVIAIGNAQVPFAVDSGIGAGAEAAFVGITASGGTGAGFEVATCCLRTADPAPLTGTVAADADGDGFSDSAFDVTLVVQNDFVLPAAGSVTYETKTLFGASVPVVPGGGESLPLMPTRATADGGFAFTIAPDAIAGGRTIWIDPDIATGYVYRAEGAAFEQVTAPSLAAVADADGYLLEAAGLAITLAPGQTHRFAAPQAQFTLSGIDPALMLDPTDPLAFVTGIVLGGATGGPITVTQTPVITTVAAPSAVPVPAAGPLLAAGLALLALRRRRRARAG